MSALLSGGALMMILVPSSATTVTPRPGVSPKLPFTIRHWPVRAGLFLQVTSAACAAPGKNIINTASALRTAHLLQRLSRRFGQEQDGDECNRNGRQQPLDRGAVGMEMVIEMAFQQQRQRPDADFYKIAQ